jgi:hypothetical protein
VEEEPEEDDTNAWGKFNFEPFGEVPPNAQHRTFNENDILGALDRDEKGNLIKLSNEKGHHDKNNHLTNQKGYLLNNVTLDVTEN